MSSGAESHVQVATAKLLEGENKEFMFVQGYSCDTNRQRQVVPQELDGKEAPPAAELRITENA
jgi:hypothetical protein